MFEIAGGILIVAGEKVLPLTGEAAHNLKAVVADFDK